MPGVSVAVAAAPTPPFVLSLSKDVVAPPAEHATWFDRLTTNGALCGSQLFLGQSNTLTHPLGAPITRRSTAAVSPVAVGWG